MDIEQFMEFLNTVTEKDIEEKLYLRWLADYAFRMDEDSFISFSEYKDKFINRKHKHSSKVKEDILSMAEKIKNKDLEKR